LIQAIKSGVGVFLTLLLVLIKPVNDALANRGIWAVVTTLVVTLKTPGETTHKILNRVIGTISGAVVGLGVGLLAAWCSQVADPSGQVVLAVTNTLVLFVVTFIFSGAIFLYFWSQFVIAI